MKLITIRSQIRSVLELWNKQYPIGKSAPDKGSIRDKLSKLDLETASEDDLAKIIGNRSWACKKRCYECGGDFDVVLEIGEPPNYETLTTYICEKCAIAAVEAFTKHWRETEVKK